MKLDDLKLLLAIEPVWTVSLNGDEFQIIRAQDISIEPPLIQIGKWKRRFVDVEWLRTNVVRIRGRQKIRAKADTFILYPGERLPPGPELRRRRRAFQSQLGPALARYFGDRIVRRSLAGPYLRFLIGKRPVIAVDPDESSATVNAVMRAALMWAPLVRRRIAVVLPAYRAQTIRSRLRVLRILREKFNWLEWTDDGIRPLTDAPTEMKSEVRPHGSRHPVQEAFEESLLQSNLIEQFGNVIPSADARHIYPQVPSFVGEERNIIDLLSITREGRLLVVEIKASADPDLPFQALDYWIAVERHRKAGDFERNGYFSGVKIQDTPALLVLIAPLLAFHRTQSRLLDTFPSDVPVMEVGVNQLWKKNLKVLRRRFI